MSSCQPCPTARDFCPHQGGSGVEHPSHVIARYSSPFKVRLHPYENILRLQLSAQFTAYATNPQRITKLNTKFFPAHLFSPSLVVRLQVLLKGKGHLSEEI